VPAEPYLSEIHKKVSELAKRFDGPEFVPHLTIYFSLFNQKDSPELILQLLAKQKRFYVAPKALLFSDNFTTSCYIKFEESERLSGMSELVHNSVKSPSDYKFSPHMSLFYGSLSQDAEREIKSEFKLPNLISFDLLKAIANPPQVKTPADVNSWYEVAQCRLLE